MSEVAITQVRAEEVLQKIRRIKSTMMNDLLDLGDLLSEAKQNDYPAVWGFSTFDDWLEHSGLDIGRRSAYYLIRIVETSKQLGIPREQLSQSKISHLKEIFTLDQNERPADIKALVEDSPNLTLDEIREAVGKVKQAQGLERLTWRNFRVTDSQADVIDEAVERAKLFHGDTIDSQTGEVVEITDGRAIEVICADFLSNPDPVLHEIASMPDDEEG